MTDTDSTDTQTTSSVGILADTEDPDRAFRASDILEQGRRFQLVRGRYPRSETDCIAKAPRYESADTDAIQARRAALQREHDYRQRRLPGLTDAVDLLRVDGDNIQSGPESVLLYEPAGEETLFEYVQRQPTSGLPPKEGLNVITRVVDWLADWHDEEIVFMDLDPRHILVERGLPVALVGATNAADIGQAPDERELPHREAPYVAPEARQERSGAMRRPLSDIYSVGALLSFILSGHEPTTAVESPLTKPAYNDLMSLRPRGIARIVAGTLHPMAKHRVESLDALQDFLHDDHLPGEDTDGFQLVDLPAPWSGAEPPGPNRSVRSDLSPGPLISVDHDRTTPAASPDTDQGPTPVATKQAGGPPGAGAQIDPVEEFSKPEDAEITSRQELAEARQQHDVADDIPDDTDEDRREIRMLDEHLGDRDAQPAPPPDDLPDSPPTDPDASSDSKPLPAYKDLPTAYRLGFAFGIPFLFILLAVLLGLAGIV